MLEERSLGLLNAGALELALERSPAMTSQLTLLEREQIAQLWNRSVSRAEIGQRLGRIRETIGRELKRNGDGEHYWPSRAHEKAQARRRCRRKKLDDEEPNVYVRSGLILRWSPEQIAGRSPWEFPRQPGRQLSHTTIYRWIASCPDRPHWESFLRYGPRRREPERRGKLPARVEIADRPAIVDERRRFGDLGGHDRGETAPRRPRHARGAQERLCAGRQG
jgi:transposase, IS30 family